MAREWKEAFAPVAVLALVSAGCAQGLSADCAEVDDDGRCADMGTGSPGNHPPTVTTPVVTPETVFNTSTLTCSATASDPDGDTTTLAFAWSNASRGDAPLGEGPDLVLTPAVASPGDRIRCVATAHDGALTSADDATAMLGDRPGSVGPASLTPSHGFTHTEFTCDAPASDPDGTPEVTYVWTNQTKSTTLGSAAILDAAAWPIDPGDTLRCTATISDSTGSRSATAEVKPLASLDDAAEEVLAGKFWMGCKVGRDGTQQECDGNASIPAGQDGEVTLTRGFLMMDSEVTQGMWEGLGFRNPSYFRRLGSGGPYNPGSPDHPVESVNWWEALAFANRASIASGLCPCYALTGCNGNEVGDDHECTEVAAYASTAPQQCAAWEAPQECEGWRLPTEAEWEYAARGDEEHAYAGSATVGDVAWWGNNNGASGMADYGTKEVCQKDKNGFDLCDMSGNVREWVWDWYAADVYDRPPVTDPTGPAAGTTRVARGGSWDFSQKLDLRVSSRKHYGDGRQSSSMGFRLVRTTDF